MLMDRQARSHLCGWCCKAGAQKVRGALTGGPTATGRVVRIPEDAVQEPSQAAEGRWGHSKPEDGR